MLRSENRTTEIRRSQGAGVLKFLEMQNKSIHIFKFETPLQDCGMEMTLLEAMMLPLPLATFS